MLLKPFSLTTPPQPSPEMIIHNLNITTEQSFDKMLSKIIRDFQAVDSNEALEANKIDPSDHCAIIFQKHLH